MANDQESILRRLRALIARAEHPNTPKPEAELSRKQAEKLMAKYSINAALLGDLEENKTKPSHFKFDIFGSYMLDRGILINGIADVFNCKVIRHQNRYGTDDYSLFGFEADLDMVWTLWESIDRQATDALFSMPGSVSFKKSFMSGFTNEVVNRLRDFYAEAIKEAEAESGTPGTAIVLANRKDEVQAYMDQTIGKTTKSKLRRSGDAGGYFAGAHAGSKADISLNDRKLANQGALSA